MLDGSNREHRLFGARLTVFAVLLLRFHCHWRCCFSDLPMHGLSPPRSFGYSRRLNFRDLISARQTSLSFSLPIRMPTEPAVRL